jgi:regulator of protease activity HflC (stomatin/prohibitin superfamily)
VLVLAVLWLLSGIAQIEAGNRAVVLRFGAVERVIGSGLAWAWPRPFEELVRVPAAERQLTLAVDRLDYDGRAKGQPPIGLGLDPRSEGYALTGDAGVVHLQGVVTYRVTDPAAYVLARGQLEPALQRLFCAAVVAACASRDLDGVMVARTQTGSAGEDSAERRERLRGEVRAGIACRLADLGFGIEVGRVDLTALLPDRAKPYFDLVLSAEAQAAQLIAGARTDATRYRREAENERTRILQGAAAEAKETVVRAHVVTDPIAALAAESSPARRALLISRLYRERIEAILRRAGSVLVVDGAQPVRVYLPGDAP